MYVPPISLSRPGLTLPFSKEVFFFINSSRAKKRSLLIFEIQFSMLFLCLFQGQPEPMVTKNKMENIRFNEEDILLINKDEDYDD